MQIKLITLVFILVSFLCSPAYAKNDKAKSKALPPGLQKNVARGKPLPPGWQMKLKRGEVMDMEVYKHGKIIVPVDSKGLITIEVGGKLVRLYKATREVVEVLK